MDNTATLVPSDQVIISAKGNNITAGDICRALFYSNCRMFTMRFYVDKSFATGMPGYATAFYTLMKWEIDVSFSHSNSIFNHSDILAGHLDLCDPIHQHIFSRQVVCSHSAASSRCPLSYDRTHIGRPATRC